jgi:hypothetical protein
MYQISPTPQSGSGAFGSVPGAIQLPPSIYDQLKDNVPNYSTLTSTASGDVGNELAGRLSPETINLLQNKAASMGVANGVPGSGFSNNAYLESLGLTSEGQIHQGLLDYNNLTGTLGQTQLNPAIAADIATQNAIDASAPNPAAAQSYAQQLFDKYMNQMNPKPAAQPNGGNYFTPAGSSTPMPYASAFA